jgi:hypothetical protein
MAQPALDLEMYVKVDEMIRIGNRAVHRAQAENRKKGVPNVYSINGILYYELPSGELSRTDPYQGAAASMREENNDKQDQG